MSDVRFRTLEPCKLAIAYVEERPDVGQWVAALFDTPQISFSFRLEWLEGNRRAVWRMREGNDFDGEFNATTVEESRECILVDDAGLLNIEMSSLTFLKWLWEWEHQRRPKGLIPLGGRIELSEAD